MNKLNLIAAFLVPVLLLTGCYEEKVAKAVSKLEIGMKKAEVDEIFKDIKFLKEQTVLPYKNSTAEETRGMLGPGHMEEWYPKNLAEKFTFDGNTKVYSYLIRKEQPFANPIYWDYVAIFYNKSTDQVIGWGRLKRSGDLDSWRETF